MVEAIVEEAWQGEGVVNAVPTRVQQVTKKSQGSMTLTI